jgi:transcriptional regulator with XRE-family HTH domain
VYVAGMRTEGQRLLRRYLDAEGLTQRALAERVARSEPTVSLWLSGENLPDVESAVAIEDATGVPARAWAEKPRRGRAA